MTIRMMSPPTVHPRTTTTIFGRSYTCAAGQAVPVPDFDAFELEANGWYEAPFGTTQQRPTLRKDQQKFFFDLTLSKMLFALSGQWTDTCVTIGGAAADVAAIAYAFFANVNFQGLEGGNTFPGVVGTDFFAASASDLAYVKARSTGPSRLPFVWERMQPSLNGALDPTYLAEVKGVADAALAAGTQVFLDCHNYMRRAVFSQVATAPYTIAAYHGVDNPDGVVTRAHLVDLWTKLATYFHGHAGVYGYDLMNEPTSDNHFGASSSSADLAAIMQACVNAIAAVDTTKVIFVEGNAYSSCKNWVSNNTSYPLSDPTGQIVYSSHCYPDYDHSGQHFGYAENASPPSGDALTATSLVDLSTAFAGWLTTHNVKGHIGETNVGIDDTRWNTVLDNGMAFWKAQGIGVSLWLFGVNFGANPYNLYPYGGAGTQAPQWKVIEKNAGTSAAALALSGPRNGTAGQASLPIQITCLGYLAADTTVTLSDGGAGGTFSPATITLPGGVGTSAVQTSTYTQSGTRTVTITATASGLASQSFTYSTDPANPVSSYAMASPKFSDWSQSNGSLTPNSTFGSDASGTNTAARLADNGANAQHTFNGPEIPILAGQPFEDQRLISGAECRFARVYVSGDSGATFGVDVDLTNGVIVSGFGTAGGVLTGSSITASTGGYWIVRTIGTLGSSDAQARQCIALEASGAGTTVYVGQGSDLYMDSIATAPNAIYVGPVHSVTVAPSVMPSGAVAAYALRKLYPSYSGSAVTVVGANAATASLGFVANDLDTSGLSALTAPYAISRMFDQSGGGNDLVQATAGNRPTLVLNGPAGKPVLLFAEGSNQVLQTAGNVTVAGALSFAAVAKITGGGYRTLWAQNYTGGSGASVNVTGNASQDWQPGDIVLVGNGYNSGQAPRFIARAPLAVSQADYYNFDGVLSSAASSFADETFSETGSFAETARVSSTGVVPTSTGPLAMGGYGGFNFFDGQVSELIIWASDRTADLPAIRTNQRAYWLPQANLAPLVAPSTPQRIIIDCDLDSDIDDAADIALAHVLANRGELTILGINTDSRNPTSAPTAEAINIRAGRPTLPVSSYQGSDTTSTSSLYTDAVTAAFNAGKTRTNYQDGTAAYRTWLAAAPNGSVKIACTGFASTLRLLLDSSADGISSMTGRQLIAAKVSALVWEAGNFPSGSSEFNFENSPRTVAAYLLANWPLTVPIIFTGDEMGGTVYSRPPRAANPSVDPVKFIFDRCLSFLTPAVTGGRRNAWGQMAVMAAARGLDANFAWGGQNGTTTIDPSSGAVAWSVTAGNTSYLTKVKSDVEFIKMLDGLIAQYGA